MDRTGYVLRLYEDRGVDTEFDLCLNGFTAVWLGTMAEEKLQPLTIHDGLIHLHAAPHKVITLILE